MSPPAAASGRVAAIVGAGAIGVGFAIVFARAGWSVRLFDADPGAWPRAREAIRRTLLDLDDFGLLAEPTDAIARRTRFAPSLEAALDEAEWVAECAPEDLPLKQRLFAELDRTAAPAAILASASSAIPISRVAAALPGRDRCLVVHPGNPPYLLRVAELVPAPFTAAAVVGRADAMLRELGMLPVLVSREIAGFVFNRLQGAVLREAYCLVRDGIVSVEDVDRVVRDGLGLRWGITGPFETADLNVQGGIRAHAARMGEAYRQMGLERGQDDPWTPALVAEVEAQRRRVLPLAAWERRVEWRNRTLMALARAQRQCPAWDMASDAAGTSVGTDAGDA